MTSRDPYDRQPYTDHAYAESHPDRLAVVARLSGWRAPGVETARILELGSGRGGNLLPMAAGLPAAALVGVDRSRRQCEEARRIAREAGLPNVRVVEGDVDSLDLGAEFDFVVAHGLCSWIPAASRRAMLAVVARTLAPGGVAYVSFNVLPGWYERLAARDWLRAFGGQDPRAALAWLSSTVSPELGDYRRRLEAVSARLGETDPEYALHEYLAEEHHPQSVSQLLDEARAAGLAYLGDAVPSETAIELLPDAAAARAQGLPVGQAQQLVDFVRCTAFRRTLLVRTADAEARGWSWPARLDGAALDALRVGSRLRPQQAARPDATSERFDGAGASLHVADAATRRALHALASMAPRSLPFSELTRDAAPDAPAALRTELLDLWLSTGALDLCTREPSLGDGTSERPVACPVARWHARHGGPITNRWHQEVRLIEPVLRDVLASLDGTRSAGDLAAALPTAPGARPLDESERAHLARASLDALAAAALLSR